MKYSIGQLVTIVNIDADNPGEYMYLLGKSARIMEIHPKNVRWPHSMKIENKTLNFSDEELSPFLYDQSAFIKECGYNYEKI